MKTIHTLGFALLSIAAVRAQVFRPEAVNGAVLGGIAGAVIGHNSGDLRHNAWKGAAIGAGAGLIFGEAIGNANAGARNPQIGYPVDGAGAYRTAPGVRLGVGFAPGYHGHSGYRGFSHDYRGRVHGYGSWPVYGYYDGYGSGYPYYGSVGYYGAGNAAANGLLLGALAGGIIGNNSGSHHGWRGAAWGAGAGWLLGSVVDANRRAVVYDSTPVAVPQAPAAPAAAPVTIINNYYNAPAPMSGANSLFGR